MREHRIESSSTRASYRLVPAFRVPDYIAVGWKHLGRAPPPNGYGIHALVWAHEECPAEPHASLPGMARV